MTRWLGLPNFNRVFRKVAEDLHQDQVYFTQLLCKEKRVFKKYLFHNNKSQLDQYS